MCRHTFSKSAYRDSRRLKLPEFSRYSAHESGKVVRPAQRPPLSSVKIAGTHFHQKLSRLQGPSATERIISTKNPNDPTGNRSRDLSVCGGVRQPTAPPCGCVVAGFLHGDRRECILMEMAHGRYVYMDITGMKKMHNYVLMILVITLR